MRYRSFILMVYSYLITASEKKHIVILLSNYIWTSYYKFTKKWIDFWYVAVLKLFLLFWILKQIFLINSDSHSKSKIV
jgi:hypothetical protein